MALPLRRRWEIVFLSKHHLGPKLSPKQIGRELSIDKKTVQHWLDVYESTNDVIEEVRCGRPRSTTAAEDKKLINFAEQHGESTSSAIAQNLKRKHVDVEPRTVRRRLNEAGIFSLRLRFAPLLNEKLRKSRLNWAEVNKKNGTGSG